MKRFQQASRDYSAGTHVCNLPAMTSFTRIETVLTRENWPGESTLLVGLGSGDAALTLPRGAGSQFPSSGRLKIYGDDAKEEVRISGKVGDVLMVERGTSPIMARAGARLLLLDLGTITFERTLDGNTWDFLGEAVFSGGVQVQRDGTVQAQQFNAFSWWEYYVDNGQLLKRVAPQSGQVRVRVTPRVPIRTALDITVLEPA